MRDKHYKIKSYRLSDEVIDELDFLKNNQHKQDSWNQIFSRLLGLDKMTPTQKNWHKIIKDQCRRNTIRKALTDRDGYNCFYCEKRVDLSNFHMDHFIPRSKGGSDDMENLRVACVSCNLRKGDKISDEWKNSL